ncbi:MAG TPA: YeeE/YedE family protein [Burkholderiaceae bacterium]|nr:YeeE/YedE family protein [Burkholderiaceae bacterium]
METAADGALVRGQLRAISRAASSPLIIGAVVAWLAITWAVGLRQGLLYLVGIGFGACLAAVSFGFTTGWRIWIRERDPTGFLAQFLAIGLAMLVSIPLIAAHEELSGAFAPLSVSLVIGAFIFGAAMQVADGCGSGTLYKAGLGNGFSLAVLPGFVAGSFLGAAHLDRWLALGSLPPVSLPQEFGVGVTLVVQLAVLGALGAWLWRKRKRTDANWQGRGIYVAAVLIAVFGVLNLIIAGQPWGIVYGLGLWGAKIATWFGADLTANAYWGRAAQQLHIESSLLTDVTSVTNIGLLIGALIAANFRGLARPRPATTASAKQWLAAIVSGLVLGYSARLAFGCNVGAYFAGISTGSLHGWVWFAAAFAGSFVGIPLRERLGLRGRA